MRKLLISLLLASAAASPALAERPPWSDNNQSTQEDRHQAREDRQSAREERSSSSNQSSNQSQSQNNSRPERPERSFAPGQQFQPQGSYQPQQQSVERHVRPSLGNGNNNPGPVERRVETYRARQQAVQAGRQDRLEQRADRLQQIRDNREARQASRFREPVVSNVPRPGTQPPLRVEQNRAPVQWSSNWRHNSKYDWQNWRRHHRSFFHLGFYYDPFGWGYNPFEIGWRMWPSYYSSRFWINDPWYYRLPYAPPGTRWIRYYDDAILVDTWTGEVVDVIYDFFW
jgi:hypothetical protein